ncbi:hypothetical protein [Serratia silvae]|nr:hypothetical protein [Serratia silvae]
MSDDDDTLSPRKEEAICQQKLTELQFITAIGGFKRHPIIPSA